MENLSRYGYYFVIHQKAFFVVTDCKRKTKMFCQKVLRCLLEHKGIEVTKSHLEDPRLLDELKYYLQKESIAKLSKIDDHYCITGKDYQCNFSCDDSSLLIFNV